jgi:hypothetical protein
VALKWLPGNWPQAVFEEVGFHGLRGAAIPRSRQLLAIQLVALLGDDQHGVELVGGDLIKAKGYWQFEGAHELERAPDQQARLGVLGSVEPVQRAMVTAAAIVGRIRAEARLAQVLAPQRPVNQES